MTSAAMSQGIAAVYCTLVRYLRMLSNSLVAGALASTYVLVLILQLNPTLPLNPIDLAPLGVTVGAFYAAWLTGIFFAVLVIRQLLGRDFFSPAWISVSVLAWLGSAAAAAGAAVMWANIGTFSLVLESKTTETLREGT